MDAVRHASKIGGILISRAVIQAPGSVVPQNWPLGYQKLLAGSAVSSPGRPVRATQHR